MTKAELEKRCGELEAKVTQLLGETDKLREAEQAQIDAKLRAWKAAEDAQNKHATLRDCAAKFLRRLNRCVVAGGLKKEDLPDYADARANLFDAVWPPEEKKPTDKAESVWKREDLKDGACMLYKVEWKDKDEASNADTKTRTESVSS